MKIKRLIMVMLIVFSLVPLYLLGGLMIARNQSDIEHLESENLEALSNTIVLNIESYLESQKLAMRQLAHSEPVQQAVEASLYGQPAVENASYEYMYDLLEERRKYEDYIVSVSVLDRDGKLVGSTEEAAPSSAGDLSLVPKLAEGSTFYIGRSYDRDTVDGQKHVVLACHTIEKQDQCIGYVLEEIDTTYFDVLRYQTTLTKSDIIYIKDGVGGLITAGRFGKRAYSESAHRVTDCEEYKEKWNAINHNISSQGHISFTNGGTRYITYYSDISDTDWLIQVTINMSTRYTAVSSYSLLVVLSLVCLTMVLSGVNYLLTRRITQPLDRIEGTLSEVQKRDDYSLRIHVENKGELGAIAEQINRLLEYVEDRSRQDAKKQRQLQRDVELDPLTGLLNKKAVHEDMEDLTVRAVDLGIEIMVGFVDVDNFRDFNTKFGHQVGDEVLRHVADCLRRAVPGVVGRNGGDEFVFCILNRRKDISLDMVMDYFYSGLKKGVPLGNGEVVAVTCSVGIIRARGAALTMAELEKEADSAMYESKKKGKNTYHINVKVEEE